MAKTESNLKNMLITLLLVTLIASTSLGLVYTATKEPIAAAKLAKKTNAIRQVVPEFNNSPLDEKASEFVDGDSVFFYPARVDGELKGIAVETFTNDGFGGKIKLMAGFTPDGTITGIEVLEHKETPGLGDKMESSKSDFSNQFVGKNPESFTLKVKKDGGNVDAITASTISSRAYCNAVRRAYETLKEGGLK